MRRFGLIGYPLGHSFSGRFFAEKFEREGLNDCRYDLFPIPRIDDLRTLLAGTPGLVGLNVTIPYKQLVIPFLDRLDPVMARIGACNCLHLGKEGIAGYNTDVVGFTESLKSRLKPHHRSALVLGSGGASKAVCHALEELGIEHLLVSRKAESPGSIGYDELSERGLEGHTLIVNTTPLGMQPRTEEAPPIPYDALTPRHLLYDLVYNPPLTRFLATGMERGAEVMNGGEMLVLQAEESWRIWNQNG